MWTALAVVLVGGCLSAGIFTLGASYDKIAHPRAAKWADRALGPAVGITSLVSFGLIHGAIAGSLVRTVTAWVIGAALGTLTGFLWMRRRKRLRTGQIDQDPDQPRTK